MKRLIKIMVLKLIKPFKRKPTVYDALDLLQGTFKPIFYVQPDGKLYVQSTDYYGQLLGMGEWNKELKQCFGMKKSDVVIDCVVKVIQIPE